METGKVVFSIGDMVFCFPWKEEVPQWQNVMVTMVGWWRGDWEMGYWPWGGSSMRIWWHENTFHIPGTLWIVVRIEQFHKSHNAPVPYPTMLHSEQKCAHFCSEWGIVWYGTGAFWDLWIRSTNHNKMQANIWVSQCVDHTFELYMSGISLPIFFMMYAKWFLISWIVDNMIFGLFRCLVPHCIDIYYWMHH